MCIFKGQLLLPFLLYCHYIYLAGIPLIPEGWKDFEFFETEGQIKLVGVIIIFVFAHLHGFHLKKGVAGFFGSILPVPPGCRTSQEGLQG